MIGAGITTLLTNFRMPGMTGIELARAVRNQNPRCPVIVMSVFEPVESEHVTLWLAKEYLFPDLLDKISYCLATGEPELVRG